MRRAALLLVIATSLLVEAGSPRVADAQEDPAVDAYRAHMKVGVDLYGQKNYVAAIAEFEEAYKAKPKASPLVNIALCYKAQFAYPKAIRALETALEKHSDTMTEDEKKAAQTEIDGMRAVLSYVTFKVTPAQFSVTVDGEAYPEAAQGKAVALSPGPHTVRVSAEGYAPVEQAMTVVSGERELAFTLKPNMGYVHIKAASSKYAIALDSKALEYGEWSGLVAPGMHIVEMYLPGSPTPPYRVRLDVEVGKSYELSPGKGGIPLLGTGGAGGQGTLPPLPKPPKPPEKPVTGPFVLATVSVFGPTEQPAAFSGEDGSPGVIVGLRGGYRVNTPVSFDLMFDYSNMQVKKRDEETVSYNLEQIRVGLNMRLQTPGKIVRFYGSFGGGVVYNALEFAFPGEGGKATCLTPRTIDVTRSVSCDNVSGVDGYFLVEAGLSFSFGSVLVDAGLGTHLQSTRGFGPGTYRDWLPMIEGGIRVGWAWWQ